MNTVFGGNQVGSRVSLDIAGSYPIGLLAALGPQYNDSQLLIQSQITYTANQADITTQIDAALGTTLLSIEKTGIVSPVSASTQEAATTYINAATGVNYYNQNLSDLANTAYHNANSVAKICNDVSYSSYLTQEAYQVYLNKVSTATTVISLGNTQPNINPIDIVSLSSMSTLVANVEGVAENQVTLASNNIQAYLTNTGTILTSALTKSTTVSSNLKLVAAFNTLVRAVTKAVADPLSDISGKETLVTQYVPSFPLNNAINITRGAFNAVNAFITTLNAGLQTSPEIISTVSFAGTLASTLDSAARPLDINMNLTDAVKNIMIKTTSTMRAYGQALSVPDEYIFSPKYVSREYIQAANEAKKLALDSDLSAVNARTVSNALIALKTAFQNTVTPEESIYYTAVNSLFLINNLLSNIEKVTSNSSAYAAVAITRRVSNTVLGDLNQIIEEEAKSIEAADDATAVTTALQIASTQAPTLSNSNLQTLKSYMWVINAAKGKAEELSEKLKNYAFALNKNAHNLVTPSRVAVQTLNAHQRGITNINAISRLDRNSRNVPVDPPAPYSPFRADIRAKTFIPVRPTLDELVFKNRLHPLRLDSIRTADQMKVRVAQQVQRIKDISAFSFRQQ
jgi:hypothetical protein